MGPVLSSQTSFGEDAPKANSDNNRNEMQVEMLASVRWVKPGLKIGDAKSSTQVWIDKKQYKTQNAIVEVVKDAQKKAVAMGKTFSLIICADETACYPVIRLVMTLAGKAGIKRLRYENAQSLSTEKKEH